MAATLLQGARNDEILFNRYFDFNNPLTNTFNMITEIIACLMLLAWTVVILRVVW